MKTALMDREDLRRTALLCHEILTDPTSSESLLKLARKVSDNTEFALMYEEFRDDNGNWPVEPFGFYWPGYYEIEVVEHWVMWLPEPVKARNQVRIAIALDIAKLVDRQGFSVTHRLESLDELNEVLAELKCAADEFEADAFKLVDDGRSLMVETPDGTVISSVPLTDEVVAIIGELSRNDVVAADDLGRAIPELATSETDTLLMQVQ